jgi:excisionase family DNA binding protein
MSKNNAWQSRSKMLKSERIDREQKAAGRGSDQPLPKREIQELMDVRGLAAYLHLDRQTIYNWLHQQKLTGIKVGGVWRFDRGIIEEWLRDQTVEAQVLSNKQRRESRRLSGE